MQIVNRLKTVANLLSANTITMGDCYGNADHSKLSYALSMTIKLLKG
jgi:tRNA A22 N-methylase